MISNANNFKTDKNRVIESHVRKIMRYVIDCYHLILKDGKKYDYSKRGKIKQEDFLRNGLVDDYMRENINLLNNSPINEYSIENFINKESAESYHDAEDGLLHDDKIDIKIDYPNLKLDLKDRTAYFAIECKRIKNDADSFPNTYEGNMKLQSLLVFANMINVAKNGHVQNVIQIITEM